LYNVGHIGRKKKFNIVRAKSMHVCRSENACFQRFNGGSLFVMDTVKICWDYFNFDLPSSIVEKRRKAFVARYVNYCY